MVGAMGGKSMASGRYVALLRGINVGGKNKLLMADLRQIFEEAGCCEVSSYIQSGNVLFSASPSQVSVLPRAISETIATRFGYQVPVIVRELQELKRLVAANPFLREGQEPHALHLMCLAACPTPEQIASLDHKRSEPDAFALRGNNIYLYFPNGTARSKFTTGYFDRALATTSTIRNWNTMIKLIELGYVRF